MISIHKIKLLCLFILFSSLLFIGCKKDEKQYHLLGNVFAAHTLEPLDKVTVSIQKVVVSGGLYNNNYSQAAHTVSQTGGQFELFWERENFASLRLDCEKTNYIKSEIDLNIDGMDADKMATQTVLLQPEAFVQVHVVNELPAAPSDIFRFTFANAHFDCVCCSNGWKTFNGSSIDTTFTCRLYGESLLKFQKDYYTNIADTMLIDSIFCPAFQTTTLEVHY